MRPPVAVEDLLRVAFNPVALKKKNEKKERKKGVPKLCRTLADGGGVAMAGSSPELVAGGGGGFSRSLALRKRYKEGKVHKATFLYNVK